MIVSIHQPHYLPWLGYFDKIDCADVFVLLDCVQFEKNGWQNRNKIKTRDGWMWLTVPVRHTFGTSIAETEIVNSAPWAKKHLHALVTNYSKAPYFALYEGYFHDVYSRKWEYLSELNTEMLRYFCEKTGISTKILTASSLGELPPEPNERLVSIVEKAGGDVYLAGSGAGGYFQEKSFKDTGITVVFQNYEPVAYNQLYNEFISHLGIVDALFNMGENTLDVIRKGRRTVL